MEVNVKVRFNASKDKLEKFGNNRYLLYVTFGEDNDSESLIGDILSRAMGVPPARVQFKCFAPVTKDWIFHVD